MLTMPKKQFFDFCLLIISMDGLLKRACFEKVDFAPWYNRAATGLNGGKLSDMMEIERWTH